MKKMRLFLIVCIVGLLLFGLFACHVPSAEQSSDEGGEIDYAKTPLFVDSESDGEANKADNWIGFRCRATVSAPTSLFDLDDVTVTLSFEGDFSDEHAEYLTDYFEKVYYCDLSKMLISIESDYYTDAAMANSHPFKEIQVEAHREKEFNNGRYANHFTIPRDFFLFKTGVIRVVLFGETTERGQNTRCSNVLEIGYEKRGESVCLSKDLIDEFVSSWHNDRYFDYPKGESAFDFVSINMDYIRKEYDDAAKDYYETITEKSNYSAIMFDKERGESTGDDTPAYYTYTYQGCRDQDSPDQSSSYKLREEVEIDYYFGGIEADRSRYEFVEICLVDLDHLDRGLYVYKRIEDYTSVEYDCQCLFSLDEKVMVVDYRHHETIIIPQDYPLDGRTGRLAIMLIGFNKEDHSCKKLAGIYLNYYCTPVVDNDLNIIDDENVTFSFFMWGNLNCIFELDINNIRSEVNNG